METRKGGKNCYRDKEEDNPIKRTCVVLSRKTKTLKKHAVIIIWELPSTKIKGSIGTRAYRFENIFEYFEI